MSLFLLSWLPPWSLTLPCSSCRSPASVLCSHFPLFLSAPVRGPSPFPSFLLPFPAPWCWLCLPFCPLCSFLSITLGYSFPFLSKSLQTSKTFSLFLESSTS